MNVRFYDEGDNCKVNLAFSYDICNSKKGVSMTTPQVDSSMLGVAQKLRVLADKYVAPMEKDWKEILEKLKESIKDMNGNMDWEEIKPLVVFAIIDGKELAHTKASCKPSEFPQALHDLVNRLAQGVEDMIYNMTDEDKHEIKNGKTLSKFGYDMQGYTPDEDE